MYANYSIKRIYKNIKTAKKLLIAASIISAITTAVGLIVKLAKDQFATINLTYCWVYILIAFLPLLMLISLPRIDDKVDAPSKKDANKQWYLFFLKVFFIVCGTTQFYCESFSLSTSLYLIGSIIGYCAIPLILVDIVRVHCLCNYVMIKKDLQSHEANVAVSEQQPPAEEGAARVNECKNEQSVQNDNEDCL